MGVRENAPSFPVLSSSHPDYLHWVYKYAYILVLSLTGCCSVSYFHSQLCTSIKNTIMWISAVGLHVCHQFRNFQIVYHSHPDHEAELTGHWKGGCCRYYLTIRLWAQYFYDVIHVVDEAVDYHKMLRLTAFKSCCSHRIHTSSQIIQQNHVSYNSVHIWAPGGCSVWTNRLRQGNIWVHTPQQSESTLDIQQGGQKYWDGLHEHRGSSL